MRVAVIGSRSHIINDLGKYLPSDITEIISGGARGVDTAAKEYACSYGLNLYDPLESKGTLIQMVSDDE